MVAADPPYSPADAARYGTPPVHKPAVLREIARVVAPGGFLIWLDTTLPLYRKVEWHHWGMICVQRSTNHRTRLCSLFTRQ
jgi:ubiquinone/menaquinone biosynthesis C-methylase UbiE